MSDGAVPLYEAVCAFVETEVNPVTEEYYRRGADRPEHWGYGEGQLELLDGLKAKARAAGLWNFFLPDADDGRGAVEPRLRVHRVASSARTRSRPRSSTARRPTPGTWRCSSGSAPPSRSSAWLEPLLAGEIRSAYAMTEPDVASSDATNVACRAELDGDEWVINGEKYYISGAGDPRCKIMIVMVVTSPEAPSHRRQSQILVPMDTPGVEILGAMDVFGEDDAPHGHMHLRFTDVRVPKDNVLLGEGRGFEISQVRLGPGPHPPLHALDRRGRAGARPHDPPRAQPRGVRQAARAPRARTPR